MVLISLNSEIYSFVAWFVLKVDFKVNVLHSQIFFVDLILKNTFISNVFLKIYNKTVVSLQVVLGALNSETLVA